MPLRGKELRKLLLMRKIINKMETNSKVKVYRVCLYKDNTIAVLEFDGEGISDTLKRKVEVFEDFNGNVGLTAVGDTEEEALKAIRSTFERDIINAQNAVKKWNTSIDVINSKLKEANGKMIAGELRESQKTTYQ